MFELSTTDITNLLATYGYWIILAVIAIESAGVPLPGESMLLAASVYASTTHRMSIVLVIVAAATGAILGDNLGYLAGRYGGHRFLRRFGRYVRLNEQRLQTGQYLFDRHGGKVVFFGRFVAVLRMWAAFLAGTHGMPWRRFMAFNAAGGIVWATVYGLGGNLLGSAVVNVGGVIGLLGLFVTMTITVGLMLAAKRSERRLEVEARNAALPVQLAA